MWKDTAAIQIIQAVISLLFLSTAATHTHAKIEEYPACVDTLKMQSDSENTAMLYILTLLPYPQLNQTTSEQPLWNEGPDVLPAAQLAVDHINKDNNILKGHRLVLINADGGCHLMIRAFLSFVDQLEKWKKHQPCIGRVAGIVGPGCSPSTLAISSLNNKAGISLLNVHIATSPLLQDRALYRNSFGILSSYNSVLEAIFSLFEDNRIKWTHMRIAALYGESWISFGYNYRYFEKKLTTKVPNVTLVYHSDVHNWSIPISDVKKSTARIIVVLTGSLLARHIMCMAYYENIIFPNYQWIIVGPTSNEFLKDVEFTYHQKNYTCSKEQMQQHALRGNLFINYNLVPIKINSTRVGMRTYEQFLSQYIERVDCHSNHSEYYTISPSIWATLAYDAVWSLALAINASMSEFTADTPHNTSLGYSQCENHVLSEQNGRWFESGIGDEAGVERVREKLQNLKFKGMSGDIEFSKETGFTRRKINIFQVINSQEVNIGYTIDGNLTLFDIPGVHFIELTVANETILPPVFALFLLITLLQLIAIVIVHMLSLYHRNKPSVKASSLKLNQLLFLGCYLHVITALFYTVYKSVNFGQLHIRANMCLIQWAWLIPITITLLTGPLTARTWRLYRIFEHFKNPGSFLTDKWLWGFILIQLGVDVIFGTVWSISDPYRLEVLPNEQYIQDEVVFLMTKCTIDHFEYWFPFLAVYKFSQLLVLFLLGLITRHIKAKHFTTRFLRVGTYLLFIVDVTLLPVYCFLWYIDVEKHIDFVVFCIALNSSILICFVCVLLPPILPIYRKY